MKLLLSCFGIGCNQEDLYYEYGSRQGSSPNEPFFFTMPAISLQTVGPGFIPDYPILLLFDEFMIDHRTFSALVGRRRWGYNEYSDLISTLYRAGRLTVESYETLLEPYKEIVEEAVTYDLRMLRSWYSDFNELTARWRRFADLAIQELSEKQSERLLTQEEREILSCLNDSQLGMMPTPDGLEILHALKSWNKALDPAIRDRTRWITGNYFRYVTSNVMLSSVTGGIIHEWFDLEPLYLKKLNVGGHPPSESISEMKQARKLFDVMFPEFHPESAVKFVNLLDDARVDSLRSLVRRAAAGEEEFDNEFTTRTLREILRVEQSIAAKRNIVGWLSQPLGFIPWVGSFIQKATEVASGRMIESRLRKEMEWFFLVSGVR